MNNRQGMNSRVPYNQRAFSPQRMMNFQQNSFNQQQQQQPNMMRNAVNNNFEQPFHQQNRNDGYQNNQNEIWERNDSNENRNNNQGYLGFNQNTSNMSNYNSQQQQQNFAQNFQQRNFQSNQDFIPLDSGSRFPPQNQPFSRANDSRPSFNHQGPGSNHHQNFPNNNNNFGRQGGPNPQQNFNRPIRNQRPLGRDQNAQRSNKNRNAGGSQNVGIPRQGFGNFVSNSFPNPSASTSIAPVGAKTDVYPDIGEPTIRPRFEDIFKVRKVSESGLIIYSCRVCNIESLPEKNLLPHRVGKKHKYHLRLIENGLSGKTKRQREKQFRDLMNGVQKEVKPKFDEIISKSRNPLIALEYVIEVMNPNARELLYVCSLCNKSCDPRTIVNHLISQTHRMTFLTKNFPLLNTKLQASRRFIEDISFRQEFLLQMASYVDSNFERCSAFFYEGTDFNDMKAELFDNISKKKHVTETDIPNFEEIFLKGFKLQDEKWESVNPPKPPKSEKSGEGSIDRKRKRKVPQEVMEKYRSAVFYVTNELEKKLVDYERDPESHPLYKKEWEIFWTNKADELTARGEDPAAHNFNNEWCKFFVIRIRELYKEELEWKTEQIRIKMGLSEEDVDENPCKRSRQDSQTSDDKEKELFSDRKGRFYVSGDDDDDDDLEDSDFSENGPRIPKDVLYVKEEKIFNQFLNKVGINEKSQNQNSKPVETSEQKEPTNLITICRLLSSLDTELGLLAPKVIELLSKAIAFERETSNPADDLLFDSENLNLIETVKEKIIGMQMAHLIESNRVKAVEKAVNGLTTLIEQHEMMVSIKKTLKEMGKDEASLEEVEMLKAMFMQKQEGSLSEALNRGRRRVPNNSRTREGESSGI